MEYVAIPAHKLIIEGAKNNRLAKTLAYASLVWWFAGPAHSSPPMAPWLDAVSADNVTIESNPIEFRFAEFDWTGELTRKIDYHYNSNELKQHTEWGRASRSETGTVYHYPDGVLGPGGSYWEVELEIGTQQNVRQIGTKSVRFYTDFGYEGADRRVSDRAEYHIRSTLLQLGLGADQNFGLKNGETLWMGWSELWEHLDRTNGSTSVQFRNQPTPQQLRDFGFSDEEVGTLSNGGPVCAIELKPEGQGEVYYEFACRNGAPLSWRIEPGGKYSHSDPIQLDAWYDFVVKLVYSDEDDGEFSVWFRRAGDADMSRSENLVFQYKGPTIYQYPAVEGTDSLAVPEVRIGTYRWGAKGKRAEEVDRYQTKYLGPLRFHVGPNDGAFDLVKPRSR